MPDETIGAIDRIFDLVDRGVDATARVLNRTEQLEEKHQTRRARREVIDVEPVPAPKTASSSSTAVATTRRKPHFRIVESVTSGGTIFVVTDGGNARAECSTHEMAEQILRALEAAP